jgi:hypothetical protein
MPEAPAACGAGVNRADAAITARNQCVVNLNGNLIAQACAIKLPFRLTTH